jgi:hypothetical protein
MFLFLFHGAVPPGLYNTRRASAVSTINGEDHRLFFSADTGRTWTQQWPKGGRDIVFTDPLHGWVLGDDTLLLYTSTGGVTAVREDGHPVVQEFMLKQNYPNPFNPSTTIQYALPHRSQVTLVVFNILGQQVAELFHGTVEAGLHEVRFDGSSLPSGVYVYRLQAEGRSQSRKLLLVR